MKIFREGVRRRHDKTTKLEHMYRKASRYHFHVANVARKLPFTSPSRHCRSSFFSVEFRKSVLCPPLLKMCRKRLRSCWLIFLGLICILGSAECYLSDEYDEDGENYMRQDSDEESQDFENRILISKREPAFTPYISIGALSNMQQFFENLKENFHSLENLSQEERKALLGKHEQSAEDKELTKIKSSLREFPLGANTQEQETRIFRPPATAAYLHAVRNHRPSHKIRNFVANAEPPYLRGSNHYDPSYLWTGLGRRR